MRHFGLQQCLAGCALVFAATSHATVYEINTTTDVAVTSQRVGTGGETAWELTVASQDGRCSLREAIYASNFQLPVDGCKAGTASNTIELLEAETYTLTAGELPVGGGKQVVFTPDPADSDADPVPSAPQDDKTLNAQISIVLALDSFETGEEKTLPSINAGGVSRIFSIVKDSVLAIENVGLADGAVAGDGGLILSSGTLALGERTSLSGGQAANGGAIYLDAGANLAFEQNTRFENNTASAKGAVIATSTMFDGGVLGYGFYMAGNSAGSGAVDAAQVYLAGDPDSTVSLALRNGTITNNTGGVINVASTDHSTLLRNMTVAFNDGVALTITETIFDVPADAVPTDQILHSVFIGNSDGVCAGNALDGSGNAEARLLFTITDDPVCPLPEEQTQGVPVTNNPNSAAPDVLLGLDRVPCAGNGAGGCEVIPATNLGGELPGFLPNPEPVAVAADPMAASLFDRGNPENVSTDLCESEDYRGESRGGAGGRCDVGAVEFLRAQAEPDEINLISGQSVSADVLANDLNDTSADCNRLKPVLVAENVCANVSDDACLEPAILARCLSVLVEPDLGSTSIEIDSEGYPRIRYTPESDFHGVDQLRYEVSKAAFFGGTDIGLNQSEIANLVAEPATGLTESKTIGAQGIGALILLLLIGFVRRFKTVFVVLLLSPCGLAMAADIEVDSLQDDLPAIKNDGRCTLREALENAGEAGSPDCAFGSKSEDRILLPAGTITLSGTLKIQGGSVVLEGKGANDVDMADDEDTLTRIEGDGFSRLFEVQAAQSNGYPSVSLRYLSLEGGVATGAGEQGNGAVIITGGSVIFDRVVVRNNRADGAGGVAYIRANAGNDKLLTFNRAYVTDNVSGAAGGVVSTTSQNGERFQIALIDSTFENNSAFTQGGVLDANVVFGSVSLANSTFFGNSAPYGAALDLSGLSVNASIINSTFLDNAPGNGIELGDAGTETVLSNSIVFNSGADCSTGTTLLKSSLFNVFSGLGCQAEDTAINGTTNDTSTGVSALSSTLNDEVGANNDYVPPYLPMSNAELVMPSVIIDAGNDDTLESGTSAPARCRTQDLRGVARTSGGACDRGAYEYQQITAGDDEGSNKTTPDRRVIVDVLDNDLASDGAEIEFLNVMDPSIFETMVFSIEGAVLVDNAGVLEVTGTGDLYTQDPAQPTRFTLNSSDPAVDQSFVDFVWRYYNESITGYDARCGEPLPQKFINANPDGFSDGDVVEDCVILFSPANNGFIPSSGDPAEDAVCEDPANADWEAPKLALLYSFTDNATPQQTSDQAAVTMTIRNQAPTIENQTKLNQPGTSIVFNVTVDDPDGDGSSIAWSTLRAKTLPSFAKRNDKGDVAGVGLLFNQPSLGQVTYIPQGNYNTFKDNFVLEVDDDCGGSSSPGTFAVIYPNDETSAGAGSIGWAMLGGLILLLRRRVAA